MWKKTRMCIKVAACIATGIIVSILELKFIEKKTKDFSVRNHSTSESQHIRPLPPITRYVTKREIRRMKRGGWSSPIVVAKYKLLFLQIEKNGCTQWKTLFHIMQNRSVVLSGLHNPTRNKLDYLNEFSDSEVRRMLYDPTWTIATVVREPRSRLLSSYFHMKRLGHLTMNRDFRYFVNYVRRYPHKNVHWEPQVRFPEWMYKHMVVEDFRT